MVVRRGPTVVGRNVSSFGLFHVACRLVVGPCKDRLVHAFQHLSRRGCCLCLQASSYVYNSADSLWQASPELASMGVGTDKAILDLAMAASIVLSP